MKMTPLIFTVILLFTSLVYAFDYEVLIVGIAGVSDKTKVREFVKDAQQLNGLHHKGYVTAKPYFSVLKMVNEQVYLVFGFRGEVQGINRNHYHKTVKQLGRILKNGASKYPNPYWVPVEEIRRLLPKEK